jgi:hypothetical protein
MPNTSKYNSKLLRAEELAAPAARDINLPPAKFAKLIRDPSHKQQAASRKQQARKAASKKDLTMNREYGIK